MDDGRQRGGMGVTQLASMPQGAGAADQDRKPNGSSRLLAGCCCRVVAVGQRDPRAEEPGTGKVEAGPPSGGAHVPGQQPGRERDERQADGNVDVEDRPPPGLDAERGDQRAARQRPDRARHGHH